MPKDLWSEIKRVADADPRYRVDAYRFVFEALEFTIQKLGEKRHVTGQELLQGIREYALQEFGMLAKMVLGRWGVTCTEDFGEIVFNLVEENLMGKTDTDTRADFRDGYDFEEAFWVEPRKQVFRLPEKTEA